MSSTFGNAKQWLFQREDFVVDVRFCNNHELYTQLTIRVSNIGVSYIFARTARLYYMSAFHFLTTAIR